MKKSGELHAGLKYLIFKFVGTFVISPVNIEGTGF